MECLWLPLLPSNWITTFVTSNVNIKRAILFCKNKNIIQIWFKLKFQKRLRIIPWKNLLITKDFNSPRSNVPATTIRQRDPAVFSITSFLLHSYSILGEDEFEEDEEEYWLLPRAHPPAREWRRRNYWKIIPVIYVLIVRKQ